MAVIIRKSTSLQSLSLTPMIDVVFLLLIFFLVASRFAEEDRQMEVQLPTANQARPMTAKPQDVELTIDADGNYYVGDGRPIALDQLELLLAQASASNPMTQTVIIRADRQCSWDAVVQAMSACHRAGLHDIKTSTSN